MRKRLNSLMAVFLSASLLFGLNSGELSWAPSKNSVKESSAVSASSDSTASANSTSVDSVSAADNKESVTIKTSSSSGEVSEGSVSET